MFGADLLAGVKQPTVLHYRYEMQGQGIDPPNVQPVAMDVREVKPDGAKSVYFDLFEGVNRRQFGPMAAQEQNPLILVLLQRDADERARSMVDCGDALRLDVDGLRALLGAMGAAPGRDSAATTGAGSSTTRSSGASIRRSCQGKPKPGSPIA